MTKEKLKPDSEAEVIDLTAGMRELAQSHTADFRAKQAAAAKTAQPGVHLVPMDEDDASAYDAAKYLADQEQILREQNAARAAREEATYRYYARCRRGHHGVYLARSMHGEVIGDHDWFATYKKKGEIWRNPVLCQVCLKEGREETVPHVVLDWKKGTWRLEERWAWKVPIDPKRWRVEGDTRAGDLSTSTSNAWRDEVNQKLSAANMEILQ